MRFVPGRVRAEVRLGRATAPSAEHLPDVKQVADENSDRTHGLEDVVRGLKRALPAGIASPGPHWSRRDAERTEQETKAILRCERDQAVEVPWMPRKYEKAKSPPDSRAAGGKPKPKPTVSRVNRSRFDRARRSRAVTQPKVPEVSAWLFGTAKQAENEDLAAPHDPRRRARRAQEVAAS